MNIKQIITVGVAGMAMGVMALDNVEVTDVKARQRYPWNGKVDIDFTLDSKPTEPYQMQVEVYDNVGKTNLPVKSVCTEGVSVEANPCMVRTDTRRIVWDAAKDLPNGFKCTNVLVTCRDARTTYDSNHFMIVDISGGPSSVQYSVSYTNQPPQGGWGQEYKTTKLVLARVEPCRFRMGSPILESGRGEDEVPHNVKLTKPYYIGVFELTYAQYANIMGKDASYPGDEYATYPVEKDWYSIRGADINLNQSASENVWSYHRFYSNGKSSDYSYPKSTKVASNSLMGVLRNKSGKSFDLPTEAQWECACRAESTTVSYSGVSNIVEDAGVIRNSTSSKVAVGSYAANAYGLYDMFGNVAEWCLDVYSQSLGTSDVTDPTGGPDSVSTQKWTTYRTESLQSGSYSIEYSYWFDGYYRVVRGQGGRSAARAKELNLNLTGSYYSAAKSRGCPYVNPTYGIRLVVTVEN